MRVGSRNVKQEYIKSCHWDRYIIEEACQLLQISKKSLYKLAKEQKIHSKKILNKWRFDKEALKAWVGGRNTDK